MKFLVKKVPTPRSKKLSISENLISRPKIVIKMSPVKIIFLLNNISLTRNYVRVISKKKIFFLILIESNDSEKPSKGPLM